MEKTATNLPRSLYKLLSCPNSHLKQLLLGQVAQGLDFQNSAGWKLYSPSKHLLCLTILRVKKVLSSCFLLLFAVCQCKLCIFSACERELLKEISKSGKLLHMAPWKLLSCRCSKLASRDKNQMTICFTEVLLGQCFSTYS